MTKINSFLWFLLPVFVAFKLSADAGDSYSNAAQRTQQERAAQNLSPFLPVAALLSPVVGVTLSEVSPSGVKLSKDSIGGKCLVVSKAGSKACDSLKIILKDAARGFSRSTWTDPSGEFEFNRLAKGHYRIDLEVSNKVLKNEGDIPLGSFVELKVQAD